LSAVGLERQRESIKGFPSVLLLRDSRRLRCRLRTNSRRDRRSKP
jgi:hypothetical protein